MHRLKLKPLLSASGLCVLLAATALGQDPRGTIMGRVSDPSDAVIPGVEIRATNMESGVSASSKSNAAGMYNIPFLLPGSYRVTAEITGFKTFSRDSVQVRTTETVELGISMQIGDSTQVVNVTAETPLLNTASASTGQVIDARRISELPVTAGNPLELMLLSPGMTEGTKFTWKPAWNYRQLASDGNGATNNEFTIDGVSNTFADTVGGYARFAFSPPASAVGEMKVNTAAYDASVGHTIGATINISTTGGTNEYHGEAHEFLQNTAFEAPNFFNNKYGTKQNVHHDNRYGLSFGGPVNIPRLYHGKNKTFFFYTWEANKWGVPVTSTGTVPTAAERKGDFSALLKVGPAYQIYDPATIKAVGDGTFSHQPFAGNIIPASRLDKVGQSLANLYPSPNQPGAADGRSNYFNGTAQAKEDYYAHLARVYHAFSDNHRVFVRLNYDAWTEDKNHWFNDDVNGIVLNRINRGLALDDVYAPSPTLVLNVRYGLTNQEFPERRSSTGKYDYATLGFSPTLIRQLANAKQAPLPNVSMGAFSGISGWESGDGSTASLTHSINANATLSRGAHQVRFGGDFRIYNGTNNRYPRMAAPVFSFSNSWTRGPLDISAAAPLGQELASALLGIPDGRMEQTASVAMRDKYLGVFVQDDYKLRPNLTLNLGLRFERESPLTERYNRLVGQFDNTVANPIQAQAQAAYAKQVFPDIPASSFKVPGGLTWVGVDGRSRSPFDGAWGHFLPRFGFAWQARPNTAVRGGYGIYFDTIGVNATIPIQTGFTQSTPIQASLDNGLSFIATNANPLPNGLIPPLGAKGGLTSQLGQAVSFYMRNRKQPYSQRWSFGVQQLLPGSFVVDASYVGNRGTHLPVSRDFDALPSQFLSQSPVRDDATNKYLSEQIASPFYGLASTFGKTISRRTMLTPYPQFNSVTANDSVGYSWYHALQVSAEKRLSHGFSFMLGYTFSKLMDATGFLNPGDPMPAEAIGNFDRTHHATISAIWEVPVGRGKAFGSSLPKVLDAFIGGWQVNGLITSQSGQPMNWWDDVFFYGNVRDIALPGSQRSDMKQFNTAAGFETASQRQPVSHLRYFPQRLASVRYDSLNTWDLSTFKNFALRERLTMQFRAECYNCMNHPSFQNADTSPFDGSDFGRTFSTAVPARYFQLALKLKF